jgi:hypothetical protein
MKYLGLWLSVLALAGCATPIVSYLPAEGQSVTYDQGVGTVTAQADSAMLTLYPTFRYQSPNDIPTFTLMVRNTTDHVIDFNPDSIVASTDDKLCHVYSLEERVTEIRRNARNQQIALAIAGGLAAGAAAYGASHQTTTFNSYGRVGRTSFFQSGSIQTYDPLAGIFAGAAVGAATGVGIHQIARAAGYQEQAAQGIFQRTTIPPGATVVGQVEVQRRVQAFASLKLEVPVEGASSKFVFLRKETK